MPKLATMAFALVMGAAAGAQAQPSACVVRAELRGIVNTGSAEYLAAAIDEAEARRCEALLVVIDTPGGELEATRRIVQGFLQARVPVVAYVAPSGARAGSAGMFVTMAAHVAAMTPGSTIGAAHPVLGGGRDPDMLGEELERKIVSDMAALARAIATQRDRNPEWAELAVRESRSATAAEALDLHVVDRIADTESALLSAIDGQSVALPGRAVRLDTASAAVVGFGMSLRQRVVTALGDPNLAYLLLMLGLLGLIVELSSPGMILPGTLGALALLCGAIGLNALPVDYGAVALLVLGVGLLAAELFVTSYGILAVGGLAAIVVGSVLLVDPSDAGFFADRSVRVSWGAVLPTAITLACAAALLAWHVRRSRRLRSTTGAEGLVGGTAETLSTVGPSGGRVRIAGESWAARSRAPIEPGQKVRVRAVSGLELEVEPPARGEAT